MMNKSGEMTIGNITKLIIAVIVVAILLGLLVRLFIPFFDKGDETAKSYFDTLKEQFDIADKGGAGEFYMWYLGDSDKSFYLVYFSDKFSVDMTEEVLRAEGNMEDGFSLTSEQKKTLQFNSLGNNKNRICVCYVKDLEATCKNCENLDHPVKFGDKGDTWYYDSGKRIKIELTKEGTYVFSAIQ